MLDGIYLRLMDRREVEEVETGVCGKSVQSWARIDGLRNISTLGDNDSQSE
jgi:hypothetical protein